MGRRRRVRQELRPLLPHQKGLTEPTTVDSRSAGVVLSSTCLCRSPGASTVQLLDHELETIL
eukprot:5839590-Heterocapsa_arctica.AAC.1